MGANKSIPIPADATASQKFKIEEHNRSVKAAEDTQKDIDNRRRRSVMAVGKFNKVIRMSGGYTPDDGGPSCGVLPDPIKPLAAAAAPSAAAAAPKRPGPPGPQHAAQALAYGGGVMKDPPRNVFGPNHVVSPDMYPEFHRTAVRRQKSSSLSRLASLCASPHSSLRSCRHWPV